MTKLVNSAVQSASASEAAAAAAMAREQPAGAAIPKRFR